MSILFFYLADITKVTVGVPVAILTSLPRIALSGKLAKL
jgi:hypothetical protein